LSANGKAPSLSEFALEERRADCPFCQLPDEVRLQLAAASRKKIPRETVFRWLKKHYDMGVADDQIDDAYTAHSNGHHDRKLRELSKA